MSAVDTFKRWVNSNKVGRVFVYYTGHLAYDRGTIMVPKNNKLPPVYVIDAEIDALAREAIRSWEQGKVHLFQRKLGENTYDYIAMRRYNDGNLRW